MNVYDYKCQIAEGISGKWRVQKFTITSEGSKMWRYSNSHRPVVPGNYTRLIHGRDVIMSDTPAELRDLTIFLRQVKGNVLINGLGLGIAAELAIKNGAEKVSVIEKELDVINLVAAQLTERYPAIEVINADAFVWKSPKGMIYDCVWHDIWPTICGDHYKEMITLQRRYLKKARWQDCWCREEMKSLR